MGGGVEVEGNAISLVFFGVKTSSILALLSLGCSHINDIKESVTNVWFYVYIYKLQMELFLHNVYFQFLFLKNSHS